MHYDPSILNPHFFDTTESPSFSERSSTLTKFASSKTKSLYDDIDPRLRITCGLDMPEGSKLLDPDALTPELEFLKRTREEQLYRDSSPITDAEHDLLCSRLGVNFAMTSRTTIPAGESFSKSYTAQAGPQLPASTPPPVAAHEHVPAESYVGFEHSNPRLPNRSRTAEHIRHLVEIFRGNDTSGTEESTEKLMAMVEELLGQARAEAIEQALA